MWKEMGWGLILIGLFLVFSGILVLFMGRFFPGGLPGDITWKGKHVVFHFPVISCIVISVILTILLNLLLRILR